jgi:hypothetical protein
MPKMIETPESSNVNAIGYDADGQELWVEFKSGTYVYLGVPEFMWEQLRDNDSKGSFVNTQVKNAFGFRRP